MLTQHVHIHFGLVLANFIRSHDLVRAGIVATRVLNGRFRVTVSLGTVAHLGGQLGVVVGRVIDLGAIAGPDLRSIEEPARI